VLLTCGSGSTVNVDQAATGFGEPGHGLDMGQVGRPGLDTCQPARPATSWTRAAAGLWLVRTAHGGFVSMVYGPLGSAHGGFVNMVYGPLGSAHGGPSSSPPLFLMARCAPGAPNDVRARPLPCSLAALLLTMVTDARMATATRRGNHGLLRLRAYVASTPVC
jgi:hypothetical protein